MDINDLNDIEYMLNLCGYTINYDNCDEGGDKDNLRPTIDWTDGASTNCCRDLNLDIPGGFQDINPLVFVLIGEFIGNVLSGQLPFNVALAVANWLNLVGQIVETYGSQQVYFQNGPGRYYNLAYRNVGNSMCSCSADSNNNGSNTNTNANTGNSGVEDLIAKLQEDIEKINEKIEHISSGENI